MRPSSSSFIRFVSWMIVSFVIETPLITYALLILKGLPSFAVPHWMDVLAWVFQATWLAGGIAGLLVSVIVWTIIQRTGFFTRPYDFGRCFSLGAIIGTLAEAFSTLLYRHFSHRPFLSFWIAGAAMTGCLVGSFTTSLVLACLKDYQPKVPLV